MESKRRFCSFAGTLAWHATANGTIGGLPAWRLKFLRAEFCSARSSRRFVAAVRQGITYM
ncbi:hypothetical protein CWO89_15605 [Bradyrhizobium sp. Leo170]|nr:hypothetical protein CWO89_15605 [Bradyrhizobium sp. Leo170]